MSEDILLDFGRSLGVRGLRVTRYFLCQIHKCFEPPQLSSSRPYRSSPSSGHTSPDIMALRSSPVFTMWTPAVFLRRECNDCHPTRKSARSRFPTGCPDGVSRSFCRRAWRNTEVWSHPDSVSTEAMIESWSVNKRTLTSCCFPSSGITLSIRLPPHISRHLPPP